MLRICKLKPHNGKRRLHKYCWICQAEMETDIFRIKKIWWENSFLLYEMIRSLNDWVKQIYQKNHLILARRPKWFHDRISEFQFIPLNGNRRTKQTNRSSGDKVRITLIFSTESLRKMIQNTSIIFTINNASWFSNKSSRSTITLQKYLEYKDNQ